MSHRETVDTIHSSKVLVSLEDALDHPCDQTLFKSLTGTTIIAEPRGGPE
jgi:hypothetical protein